MATALFENVIFGPIRSRRLGISLGINLLSLDQKLCNFECIYCECGWKGNGRKSFNPKEEVIELLSSKLQQMHSAGEHLDVMTFAGNGEPTTHPHFAEIIDATCKARDQYFPEAKIAVLSNATMIDRPEIREALLKVDDNILKLDSAFEQTVQLINQPHKGYSVARTVEMMQKFEGKMILQTMFLRGTYEGVVVDNTTEEEVSAWLELVKKISPRKVMIYTIDRDTPAQDLHKVSVEDLKQIASRVEALGIECSVAG
jgi:wyosine [tRNA(Phe)-imidazoG37] synthetase (radical SAM superfamily)